MRMGTCAVRVTIHAPGAALAMPIYLKRAGGIMPPAFPTRKAKPGISRELSKEFTRSKKRRCPV